TVYTVAAETRPAGLLYLTVGVARTEAGRLALTGYPALVGPPASQAAIASPALRPVEGMDLQVVVKRALANYLAGAGTDLAADPTSGAAVSSPTLPLELVG